MAHIKGKISNFPINIFMCYLLINMIWEHHNVNLFQLIFQTNWSGTESELILLQVVQYSEILRIKQIVILFCSGLQLCISWCRTIPLQVFHDIGEKCGLSIDKQGSLSPQKLSNPRKDNSPLIMMIISDFQDIVLYLADIALTLANFLEIHPKSCDLFLQEQFIPRYLWFLYRIYKWSWS